MVTYRVTRLEKSKILTSVIYDIKYWSHEISLKDPLGQPLVCLNDNYRSKKDFPHSSTDSQVRISVKIPDISKLWAGHSYFWHLLNNKNSVSFPGFKLLRYQLCFVFQFIKDEFKCFFDNNTQTDKRHPAIRGYLFPFCFGRDFRAIPEKKNAQVQTKGNLLVLEGSFHRYVLKTTALICIKN